MSKRLSLMLFLLVSKSALASEIRAGPSDYQTRVDALLPGDTLQLEGGTYEACLRLEGINGTPSAPIVIEGPMTGARAVFTASNCQDANPLRAAVVQLERTSYVALKDLEIDVQHLAVDGVEAGYAATAVHHITLERLFIHDSGNQQANGISTKCPVWDWTIRETVIEHAGTGLYLGDSDGSAPFIRGMIEHNLIRDPIGYGMQIKHQLPRPNLSGLPTERATTVIRRNVFSKASGASVGDDARPNLLVGHFPLSGTGQNDRYEIYGNFFYQNASGTEGLFQGEGNVAFHDNVLINTFGPGVVSIPHNDFPREIAIDHNTIWTNGVGILEMGGAPGFRQWIAANAVFAAPSTIEGESVGNVFPSYAEAANYLNRPIADLPGADLYPRPGMLRGDAITDPLLLDHLDFDRDFNGTLRDPAYRGAYSGEGPNPGWPLALALIPDLATMHMDAGIGDAHATESGMDAETQDASAPPRDASDLDANPRLESEIDGGSALGAMNSEPKKDGCSCRGFPATETSLFELLLFGLALVCVRFRGDRRDSRPTTPGCSRSTLKEG